MGPGTGLSMRLGCDVLDEAVCGTVGATGRGRDTGCWPAVFVAVWAGLPQAGQDPGRGAPGAMPGVLAPGVMDVPRRQSPYRISGDTWGARHWEKGVTDVRYAGTLLCPQTSSGTGAKSGQSSVPRAIRRLQG